VASVSTNDNAAACRERADPRKIANLRGATLLGLGGGLRSFAPPVALARRGLGPFAGAARFIAFGAAAGELIADKQPDMKSRLSPRGLTLRIGLSGNAGHELAGWGGAGIAAAAAVATAFAGSHVRAHVRDSRAQWIAAVVEDATSYALVLAGTSTRQ
jgi:uncharacterized membrane protein